MRLLMVDKLKIKAPPTSLLKAVLLYSAGLLSGYLLERWLRASRRVNQQSRAVPRNQNEEAELLNEQLTRNIQFFGKANQQRISNSYVLVFGAGGVGSHVICSLVRAGVRTIGIVDFDRVTLSSLNRHAFATREHVGRSKVEIFLEFTAKLNPNCKLILWESFVDESNVASYFNGMEPDYVIDCIDNLPAKCALIEYCLKNNIRIQVSSGAGMKADPTRLQIRDISESKCDPLARSIRRLLKHKKIKTGFKILFSYENSEKELVPLSAEQQNSIQEYKIMPRYRIRTVPVFGCTPALFAYALTSYVLCELGGHKIEPYKAEDFNIAYYDKLFNVMNQEALAVNRFLEIDFEEMVILVREVYGLNCLVTEKKCTFGICVLWDPEKPYTFENLVFMNRGQASKHKKCKTLAQALPMYSEAVRNRKKDFDARCAQLVECKRRRDAAQLSELLKY